MRNLLAVLIGIAAAIVFAGLLANSVIMPRLVQRGSMVPVPSLAGMSLDEARRTCEAVELQLVEGDRRYSADLPAGSVVAQTPAASTPVKKSRGVRVTTSLGQERVGVPNLRGMTLRQANLQLANAQLVLGHVTRVRAGPAGEKVRASAPHEGAEVALGDSVDVLLTLGPTGGPWLVPSLLDQDVNDVRALVESRGFAIGRVTPRNVPGVFPGTVLEQYPPARSWIRRGESIDLVVANPN